MSASPPPPDTLRFPSGDGACEADLHLPGGARGPVPVVILAHGIGAQRDFGLARFARRFVREGMAALVFDYRHHGGSPGTPRALVSPARQVEDYRAAIDFVRGDPRLDGGRVGLWGTSFSGGHVLVTAAGRPPGVRAVVSQIPFVSGLASTFAYPLRYHLPAILLGIADGLGARLGRDPITVPVVRERGLALLASPDSHAGYRGIVPEGSTWPGRVPARVFLEILRSRPARHTARIEVPVLFLVASDDAICPPGATRRAARRTPRAELEAFPVGHFDPYQDPWFDRFADRAAAFLRETLDGD